MSKEIHLIKNNDNKDQSDLEWVKSFYEFLRNEKKLNNTKSFSIIYFLQEHLPVFPDHIEKCITCGELFDSYSSGHYSELTLQNYCSESCEPRKLYEREQAFERRQYLKSKEK